MWEDEKPETILSFMNMIPNYFKLSELFTPAGPAKDYTYVFKGAVFYWGMHYFDYLRVINKNGEQWAQINDTFLQKEDGWPFVLAHCLRFSIRPTLLIFERLEPKYGYSERDLDKIHFSLNDD